MEEKKKISDKYPETFDETVEYFTKKQNINNMPNKNCICKRNKEKMAWIERAVKEMKKRAETHNLNEEESQLLASYHLMEKE